MANQTALRKHSQRSSEQPDCAAWYTAASQSVRDGLRYCSGNFNAFQNQHQTSVLTDARQKSLGDCPGQLLRSL